MARDEPDVFWSDAGAKLLIRFEKTSRNATAVNELTPKDYKPQTDSNCPLVTMFDLIDNIPQVNKPFRNQLWTSWRSRSIADDQDIDSNPSMNHISISCYDQHDSLSFYELAYSRCCLYLSQLLGDKFPYVQKVLIKNIFSDSDVRSFLASDLYVFTMRIVSANRKVSMCQLIMNLCKLAPPEALVRGAALINRIKHPTVNFENPKYQHLLDFS